MKKIHVYLIGRLFILLALYSCKKTDVVQGDGNVGYVNFFNASEVLLQNESLSRNNMIITNDTIDRQRRLPAFIGDGDVRQYPRTTSGDLTVVDYIGTTNADVFWLPIKSDNYRFIYTSINKVYLKDTAVNVPAGSFTSQYLVESPQADNAYQLITVPVEMRGVTGKVRIQVINLSPDLGPIKVYLSGPAGNIIDTELPTALPFATASKYVEINLNPAYISRGKFILNFCKPGTTEALATLAIPADDLAVYTLLMRGFSQNTTRRIKKDNNGGYTTVTVTPNLRATQRRIY